MKNNQIRIGRIVKLNLFLRQESNIGISSTIFILLSKF
nr:MAG TPA: hypothetical protein [Crassvirales sp.]